MSDEADVMFRIGVMEHPQTKARMEALAKAVLDTQREMTRGVSNVGSAAGSVTSEVRSAADGVKSLSDEVMASIEDLTKTPSRIQSAFESMPSNLRSVFGALGNDARGAAKEIEDAFSGKLTGLANTADLRNNFNAEFQAQVREFNSLAASFDSELDRQAESGERLNQSMTKASRSLIGAARGFAELGLVSEEDSKKILQGLVMIQGGFDILDGAVDMLEAFSMGWKAVRQSTEAANKAAEIQKAMMGPQFAMMRAYQAQLIQEAAAANTAAIANSRLSASRGGGIAAGASSLASTATNAAGSTVGRVAGGAAGGAVGAGGLASVVGTSAAGLASIAAVGAALAALAGSVVLVSEAATGAANKEKSWTSTLTGMGASILRLSGLFEKQDGVMVGLTKSATGFWDSLVGAEGKVSYFSAMIGGASSAVGDFAQLAASTASLERAEKRFAINQASNNRADEIRGARLDANNSSAQTRFGTTSVLARSAADNTGARDALAAEVFNDIARTQADLAAALQVVERGRSGGAVGAGDMAQAESMAQMLQRKLIDSEGAAASNNAGMAGDKLSAETDLQAAAMKEMAAAQKVAADEAERFGEQSAEHQKAISQVKFFEDQIATSLQNQNNLVKQKTQAEQEGARKVQDLLRGQIALEDQKLAKLEDGYQSAAERFGKLSKLEQSQTLSAFQQAQAKGAESLTKDQRGLLESSGIDEAQRFARQANLADAKNSGFDATFGAAFEQQKNRIQATQQKLKAELDVSYNYSIDIKSDEQKLINGILKETNALLDRRNKTIMDGIKGALQDTEKAINDKFNQYAIANRDARNG